MSKNKLDKVKDSMIEKLLDNLLKHPNFLKDAFPNHSIKRKGNGYEVKVRKNRR